MIKIRRALLSVSDKRGLPEFGRFLCARKVHLLSTGGTAKLLCDTGIEVTEVADHTGFPEIMDGRVKTCTRKFTAVSWVAAASTTPRWRRTG